MKTSSLALLALASRSSAETATPVTKVLELLSNLQSKITSEAQAAQKIYEEAAEWCEDTSKDLQFQIKTGKAESAELQAVIEKETAQIGALNAKVDELTASTAESEGNLKQLTAVREKEKKDFLAEERELNDIISMLTRAVGILEREMAKGGASMLQLKDSTSIANALSVLVDASGFRSADVAKLTALVQTAHEAKDQDEDSAVGAPDAATYEGHSGNIVKTLEDLLDKAQQQLSEAQKSEANAAHNYAMMKQSIDDENRFAGSDLEGAKKGLSGSKQKKSVAEGDLSGTSKALKEDEVALADLHQDCMTKAQDYEAQVQARTEEMKAITDAKKLISESVGGAADQTYGNAAASFLQLRQRSGNGAPMHVVRMVRDLAMKQHSKALMQLSHKMSAALSVSNKAGTDPFGKVKGLIVDMIAKLEDDADTEASHKAYCDKEMSETKAKDDDKSEEIESLSTSIDQMTSATATLREEIAVAQKALANLASSQARMNAIREEEKAAYTKNKAEMEEGLQGVQMALKILRDYYASDSDSSTEGAGKGIIGLLEVIESDFTKGLAECQAAEEGAAAAYEKETNENQVETASKQQDVKYKSSEVTSLEKAVSEATADRNGVQTELDAVREYMASLEKQCVAKPETYSERKERREAEIAGLKDALSILEGEAVLLQQHTTRRITRHLRAGF